jgi:hypothetical protein
VRPDLAMSCGLVHACQGGGARLCSGTVQSCPRFGENLVENVWNPLLGQTKLHTNHQRTIGELSHRLEVHTGCDNQGLGPARP